MLQELRVRHPTLLNEIKRNQEKKKLMSLRDTIKDRGRPKSNGTINANKEWSDEEIFLLIDNWREINQLYKVKHPKYHLKDKRTKNLCLLAEKLLGRKRRSCHSTIQ